MNNLVSFFIGILVALLILIPLWVLSMRYGAFSNLYLTAFCSQAITYPGNAPIGIGT